MASAPMPTNSIKPIFSDEEAKIINNYFEKLYKIQSQNLWSKNYSSNYLTIKDLEYVMYFFIDKVLHYEGLTNTNKNSSISKTFKNSFKKLFTKKNKILPKITKQHNNNNNNNNKKNNGLKSNKDELFEFTYYLNEVIEEYKAILERQNSQQLEELRELLDSIILHLINKFILNLNYFNKTELKNTLNKKTFIFMPDKYLKTILDELEAKRFLGKSSTYNTSQQKGISKNNIAMLEHYKKVVGKLPPVYPGQLAQNYLITNTKMKELYI